MRRKLENKRNSTKNIVCIRVRVLVGFQGWGYGIILNYIRGEIVTRFFPQKRKQ